MSRQTAAQIREQRETQEAEYLARLKADLPAAALQLVALASKYSYRMEVEFTTDPLVVTFWDKEQKDRLTINVTNPTIQTSWDVQEIEEWLEVYKRDEERARVKDELRRNARAKLSAEELEALGIV